MVLLFPASFLSRKLSFKLAFIFHRNIIKTFVNLLRLVQNRIFIDFEKLNYIYNWNICNHRFWIRHSFEMLHDYSGFYIGSTPGSIDDSDWKSLTGHTTLRRNTTNCCVKFPNCFCYYRIFRKRIVFVSHSNLEQHQMTNHWIIESLWFLYLAFMVLKPGNLLPDCPLQIHTSPTKTSFMIILFFSWNLYSKSSFLFGI